MDRNEKIKVALSRCWFSEMCSDSDCPYAKRSDNICWFTDECIGKLKQDILDAVDTNPTIICPHCGRRVN